MKKYLAILLTIILFTTVIILLILDYFFIVQKMDRITIVTIFITCVFSFVSGATVHLFYILYKETKL